MHAVTKAAWKQRTEFSHEATTCETSHIDREKVYHIHENTQKNTTEKAVRFFIHFSYIFSVLDNFNFF